MLREPESKLLEVMVNSFRELRSEPVLFAPKIVSATLSSLWFLAFAERIGSLSFYLATMPLLIFLGVFVSVMVAAMVKERAYSLIRGIELTLEIAGKVLSASLVFLVITFLISIPGALGLFHYQVAGSFNLLFLGMGATVLLSLAIVFVLYFLPVTLLSEDSLFESYLESRRTSVENSVHVTALTVFSFLLFGIAFLSSGWLEALGYIGFLGGRLLSSVFTTYIFVVSPEYYMEASS